ncbi:GNAT family N-acetyltransferase [uncultured Cardiobacterium sp.]|uniref:GNAT family N-acetyltransferase n=1 Tax=uncultured Cardiobacterium sp. TaxID=417619 RepID=UPI00262242AB|nr:GNAT family N-acetyltransferase [uncultured Cardiobacterium sp.]
MMLSAEPEILPYRAQDKNAVLALSLRAWQPVFAEMRRAVPAFVYHNFYPAGWEKRQLADLGTFLDEEAERVWLAWRGGQPVGWVGIRLHPEDNMGEIYVLAVDPACQRQGIGRHLMTHAFAAIRAAGMAMVMVETGDEAGHLPARAAYEAAGFQRWPVARYFKKL